MEGKPQHKRQ